MSLIFEVPTDEENGVRKPSARPEADAVKATIGPRTTTIETDRWVEPPEEAALVSGEPEECDQCDALFEDASSLRGHQASHSDGE